MNDKKEVPLSFAGRFDVRLISLYSRRMQDGAPRGFSGHNQFYSFCYFDAIEVHPVELSGTNTVLRDAYDLAHQEGTLRTEPGFCQVLVAMTDIADHSAAGYSKEEIDSFWNPEHGSPLFFISMINIASADDLDRVLEGIKRSFAKQQHLAYITFDHCDIIIFCRGASFKEYTRSIFDLYYATDIGLEDAITLYNFSAADQGLESPERFDALIEIGVKDYPSREDFYKKLSDSGEGDAVDSESMYWLLGRNDIAFYRKDASLTWLAKVRKALLEVENVSQWHTTYNLTVLIHDGTDEDPDKWKHHEFRAPNALIKPIQNYMETLYEDFRERYEAAYAQLQQDGVMVYSDRVLLRWLEKSCRLVVSLMSSRLSKDLGLCLFSQFMDMLIYGKRLFAQMEGQLTRNDLEKIQKSYRKFFSNVAVLVDSMNQSNRQFVQVPAFHLPSLDIPPQIMAFYTVILQKVLGTLKDKDKDIFYGFTVSPQLVNSLSVFSIGMQDPQLRDEWISMNMDESSFYSLRFSTETIAHEVSHFVGETARNREFRKECILKCAFELLVNCLGKRFAAAVDEITASLYGVPEEKSGFRLYLYHLREAANTLWSEAALLDSKQYDSKSNNYSINVEAAIKQLAQDIYDDSALCHALAQQIWDALCKSSDPGSKTLLKKLQFFVKWKLGLEERVFNEEDEKTFAGIVANEAEEILVNAIEEVSYELTCYYRNNSFASEDEILVEMEYLCYMFRETFADLQAIILLDMKWEDYCKWLLQGNELPGADHVPRMYSVTKALVNRGIWKEDFSYGGEAFGRVRDALPLDLSQDGHKLAMLRVPPSQCFYLTEYLEKCAQDIQRIFEQDYKEAVADLRKIHGKLDDSTSLLELQKLVLSLTNEYRTMLLECDPASLHK